jgi:hypothetical protein
MPLMVWPIAERLSGVWPPECVASNINGEGTLLFFIIALIGKVCQQ